MNVPDAARRLRQNNPVADDAFAGAASDGLGRATFERISTSPRKPAPAAGLPLGRLRLRPIGAAVAAARYQRITVAVAVPALASRILLPRRRRVMAAGAGLAIIVTVAGAVAVAAIGGSGPAPAGATVLTAAMVRQVATASRTALERSGRAEFVSRDLINGVVDGSITGDLRFSGRNWEGTWFQSKPTGSYSRRVVDGQSYFTASVHGRQKWLRVTGPDSGDPDRQIPDPRTLLGVLDPSARFRASGYQVSGGIPLKVLSATDPGALTRLGVLNSLPYVDTYRQNVASLQVWVDQRHVVHRMAITFRGPIHMAAHKPLSQAAFRAYQRANRTLNRVGQQSDRYHARTGQWLTSRVNRAFNRQQQAFFRAFPGRVETQVQEFTVSFTAIGQPQHITAPRHALSCDVVLHGHCT